MMAEQKENPGAKKLGLRQMEPLDVSQGTTTSALLQQLSKTAFTGRALGEATDLMETMIRDPRCVVVMTLSGAMTMAGLGSLIRLAIEHQWVQCIVATGALVGHGLVDNLGMRHYKADPAVSDEEYFRLALNRVYDTIEPEENLDDLEIIVRAILTKLADQRQGEPVGTAELLRFLGQELPGEGILQSAALAQTKVFIPAFTDSELGLDFAVHRDYRLGLGQTPLSYDAYRDLELFREFCQETLAQGRQLGIFSIGGGVPRNWAQQVGPYVDVRRKRLGVDAEPIRFTYGLRICPDPVHYGHLSGCTYSEGVSWGKFVPLSEGGRHAEVLLDATVGWPLLARAMLDRGL
jgi:deoxyhypusine synthase